MQGSQLCSLKLPCMRAQANGRPLLEARPATSMPDNGHVSAHEADNGAVKEPSQNGHAQAGPASAAKAATSPAPQVCILIVHLVKLGEAAVPAITRICPVPQHAHTTASCLVQGSEARPHGLHAG